MPQPRATKPGRLSDRMVAMIAARFKALGEPQRIRIVQTLEQGPRTVGELVTALETSQPNVSRHLQTLFDAGLVDRRRVGNSVQYSISDPFVNQLCDLVCRSAEDELRTRLADLRRTKTAP